VYLEELSITECMLDSSDKCQVIKNVLMERVRSSPNGKIPLHTLHSSRLTIKSLFAEYLSPVPEGFLHTEDELVQP
jgi:hypothetical protein